MTATENNLLTVKQAAAVLNISVASFYLLLSAQKISSVKLGKSRRVAPDEIKRLIAANTIPAQGEQA